MLVIRTEVIVRDQRKMTKEILSGSKHSNRIHSVLLLSVQSMLFPKASLVKRVIGRCRRIIGMQRPKNAKV